MFPCSSDSNRWQIATKRSVVRCGCVSLAFLAIVGFGLLRRIQAAENILPDHQASAAPTQSQPKPVANYGKLPLSFEANQGQVSGAIQFLSRGLGYTLFLAGDEAILSFGKAADVAATLKPAPTASADQPSTDQGQGAMESVFRMKLIGANASAVVAGADELPGKSNYFIGSDPAQWRTNVPNYAKVKYQNIYPGVDLVYYGSQGGQLEYDFVVAPGADAHSIGLSFSGAGHIRVDKKTGDLVLTLNGSELRFRKPVVYQEQSPVDSSQLTVQDETRNSQFETRHSSLATRHFLDGRFVLTGRNQIGFQVAAYDRRAPLVIDPVLEYSTFLGGGKFNIGYRVAGDASGSAYVAGATNSSDFPTTAGVFGSVQTGTCLIRQQEVVKVTFACPDAFVTKLDPTGTQLVYSTYLGGSAPNGATGISVDSSGNAYVTGTTSSRDFPVTAGAFQTSVTETSWFSHAFAAKLNPAGSALIYSTYLGGSQNEASLISALDSGANLYLAGGTNSPNFPTTAGAFRTAITGTACIHDGLRVPCGDGFIAKLNPTGTALVYSTFLGGSNHDAILGLALDSAGSAYVTGATLSTDFPMANALQSSFGATSCGTTHGGSTRPCFHAFATKLNPAGTSLDYSTYLGGSGDDAGFAIAVDTTGAAYVTGATNSTNFPTTAGAVQTSFGGGTCGNPSVPIDCPDAFVAKLAPLGTTLAYSTYLGGGSFDFGMGIAVDTAGIAYVVGGTDSLDFPTDATTGNFAGGSCSSAQLNSMMSKYGLGTSSVFSFNCPNAFLTEIGPAGATMPFSTYLGGASGDVAFGVALDSAGSAYVAGSTLSDNFPITAGSFQTSFTGYVDAFVGKFGPPLAATPSFSIPSGNYTSVPTVTISDATAGATIYYTTDGTTPTTASTPYTGAIPVNSSETIKAMAAASGYTNSLVAIATYTITISTWSSAATPSFSIPSGTYSSALTVAISDATTGAAIYYTTNGTTPSTASDRYTSAITVDSTETIEAIAVASGYNNSAVATATYLIYLTAPHEWTWMGGSSTVPPGGYEGQPGVYGTLGVPAAGNIPGGRSSAISSTDKSGDFWLFGGVGYDSTGRGGDLNDLWEFKPSTKEWAWMSGGDTACVEARLPTGSFMNFCGFGIPGVYGTQSTPAAGNVPGSRTDGISWTDSSGHLWLFGGYGNDSNTTVTCISWNYLTVPPTCTNYKFAYQDYLNDLWEFNPSTREWAWMGGSSTFPESGSCGRESNGSPNPCGQPGVYGTLGVPAAGNVPGSRQWAFGWTDESGNFWLFGGDGFDSTSAMGFLNDLWEFNPSTGEWTWMSGSNTGGSNGGQPGVYGTLGTPAAGNIPGSRGDAATWTDSSGNLWLFGGHGYDASGSVGELNDLWEFNPSTKQWTWMGGSSTIGTNCTQNSDDETICAQPGVYGTLGTPAAGNIPGGRVSAVAWTDSSGNLWLFGGDGADSTGNGGDLNDLWEFNPSTKQWTWMGGSSTVGADYGQSGVYGTLGTPYAGNVPGGREGPNSWTDSSGNFWLFGGGGFDSTGTYGFLNDLWEYQPYALPAATPTFSVEELTFSAQIVGTSSSAQTVSLTNLGNASLAISSTRTGGDFSQTNTCGTTVSAGANCTIWVTFKPIAAGTRTGALSISDNAADSPQTVALSGTGLVYTVGPHPPVVQPPPVNPQPGPQPLPIKPRPGPPVTHAPLVGVSSSSLTFSPQIVGASSSPQTVTVTNAGDTALTFSSITASGDFSQTNTCGSTVSAGDSCTISVTFKPAAAGAGTGTLSISDDPTGTPQTVALSGTGVVSTAGPHPEVVQSQPVNPQP